MINDTVINDTETTGGKMTNGVLAQTIARNCSDAYSTFRYASWPTVAEKLLDRGLTEQEVEAVMRSKWMRWAADNSPARYGRVPAKAILQFLDSLTNERRKIAELMAETSALKVAS